MPGSPAAPGDNLKTLTGGAPALPGVYRFLGDGGKVLYIGKARNIRARLQGHLANPGDRRHRLILEKSTDDRLDRHRQ